MPDIFDTQPTCGELSCDECNERYKKAVDRIAALEDVVRELVKELPGNQCMCGKTQYLLGKIVTCRICLLKDKALEHLNGGK